MKAIVAAVMLAGSPLSPPPLVPMDEAPQSIAVPPWWAWAIGGTVAAQVIGTIAIFIYVVVPLLAPPPIPAGGPR